MKEGHDFAKILGGQSAVDAAEPKVTDLSQEPAPEQVQREVTNDDIPTLTESVNEVENTLNKESSLNSEATTPQESKSEFSEGDVLSYLSEKLGRNVESFESLTQEPNSNSVDFASEQLRALNEYVKDTGRGAEDYFRAQAMDLENISSEDLLKKYISHNNPDYTAKEVDLFFKHTYKQDSDKYDEDEAAIGSLQMKRDVREAKQLFEGVKQKYYSKEQSPNEMSGEEVQKIREEWTGNMESQVDELEGISFDINGNGEEFTFTASDEAKKGLKETNKNLDSFFNKYVSEEGNWDYDQLNQDMFILNNIEEIVRGVANQYRSKGTEQVIKDAKNINMSSKEQPTKSNSKSIGVQIADEIFKNSTRWNR
tara:strand:+ start:896 stop:1999 length:1104 start_codon:yes stop_codon:yes gene_type:complete